MGEPVPEYHATTPASWEPALHGVDRAQVEGWLADPAFAGTSIGRLELDRQGTEQLAQQLGGPSAPAPSPSSPSLPPGISAPPGAGARPAEYQVDPREIDPALGLEPLPGAPRSPAEADAQVGQGVDRTLRAGMQAESDKFAAQEAEAQRLAGVDEQALRQTEEDEKVRQRAHELARQAADKETADWLTRQQEAASAEPDPSRYFRDSSTFSQVAWIVGLLASSLSAGADQSKNVALRMLSEAIDRDVRGQEAAIGRRMDGLRAEGAAMDKRQARVFQEVNDQAAGRFQRLQALRNYLTSQAKIPGSEARKASLSAADAWAAGEQQKVLETRAQRAYAEHEAKVERNFRAQEAAKADARQAWREKQDRLWREGEAQKDRNWKTSEEEKEFERRKALAMVSSSEAAGTAVGPTGVPKDHSYFDKGTGVELVSTDGSKTSGLLVQNSNKKDTAEAVNLAVAKFGTLSRLRKAISEAGDMERFFATDGAYAAAVEEAAGAAIHDLNKGATSENDRKVGYVATLGFDPKSFIGKLKGPDKAEVLKLIDSRLQALPAEAEQKILTQAGVRKPDGFHLRFIVPDELKLRPDVPAPTYSDGLASEGLDPGGPAHPTTPDEYRAAKKKAQALSGLGGREIDFLPDLDNDLDAALRVAANVGAGANPKRASEAYRSALRAIDDWEKHQKEQGIAKAQAADARVRAIADFTDAEVAATRARQALLDAGSYTAAMFDEDPIKIEQAMRRTARDNKIGFTAKDIDELVKEAIERSREPGRYLGLPTPWSKPSR